MNNNNFKVGDLVTKSKDWEYGKQVDGAIFGKIIEIDNKPYEDKNIWCQVRWEDYKGKEVTVNSYRIGPISYDIELYLED